MFDNKSCREQVPNLAYLANNLLGSSAMITPKVLLLCNKNHIAILIISDRQEVLLQMCVLNLCIVYVSIICTNSIKSFINLCLLFACLFFFYKKGNKKDKESFVTPGGVTFSLQFVCVCVCLCLSVRHFLWTKFQPNGCIDLDAVFAKWLLTAMAQTLLNLVTLGQRSRSQWRNTHFFFIILCLLPYLVS